MISRNRLRELRCQRGLAQQAVAVAAGTNVPTIVAIERYGYVPQNDLRQRIAKAVGVEETAIWPGLLKEGSERI